MKAKKHVFSTLVLVLTLQTLQATLDESPREEKPKLKILFVLNQFPKFIQQFILNQITGMIDLGHDVHIYANNRCVNNIPPVVETYNLLEKTTYRKLPPDHPDYDIIYCHFGPDGYVGLELKKQYNLTGKVATCFRGDDISQFLQKKPNKKPFKRRGPYRVPCHFPEMYHRLFKLGKLFLPVCDYFKQKLISLGCKESKIKVGHSAIDCNKFAYKKRKLKPHKAINLMSVCRLVEKKGLIYAVQAVAQLCKKYPTIHYTIVGDGTQKERLQELIDALDVNEHISLVGWMGQEEVIKLLQRAHLFLLPAITAKNGDEEGIPNALKEAMACGLPVISTHHSGIPELVINEVSGFLVEQRSIEAIVEKLEYIIEHPELVKTMGAAGRQQVEAEFNKDTENLKLEAYFYKLSKKSPIPII